MSPKLSSAISRHCQLHLGELFATAGSTVQELMIEVVWKLDVQRDSSFAFLFFFLLEIDIMYFEGRTLYVTVSFFSIANLNRERRATLVSSEDFSCSVLFH